LAGRVRQQLGTGSMWARVVDGLLYLDEDHWDYQFEKRATVETVSLRNQQMGQNVLWWLSRYPKEKVIVWAANFHVAQTHREYQFSSATAKGHAREYSVATGQWLADSLGEDYFTIAVSAAGGAYGFVNEDWSEAFGPATASMLEHGALGGTLQLLPRSELLARGRAEATMMGSSVDTAEWGKLFDALLVIPTERPVEAPAGCAVKASGSKS
jgi:erythromycin esterase-like protein